MSDPDVIDPDAQCRDNRPSRGDRCSDRVATAVLRLHLQIETKGSLLCWM